MLESSLETKFSRLVKARRGLAFKLAPTMKGLPDRLVVMPGGRLYLVELKTEDGKRSPAQVLLHSRLAAMGVEVVTLYGPSQIEAWVESIPRVCRECGTTLVLEPLAQGDYSWVHPMTGLMRCSEEVEAGAFVLLAYNPEALNDLAEIVTSVQGFTPLSKRYGVAGRVLQWAIDRLEALPEGSSIGDAVLSLKGSSS